MNDRTYYQYYTKLETDEQIDLIKNYIKELREKNLEDKGLLIIGHNKDLSIASASFYFNESSLEPEMITFEEMIKKIGK